MDNYQNRAENLYFVLSGVLSLFIYLFFVFILFFILNDDKKVAISIPSPSISVNIVNNVSNTPIVTTSITTPTTSKQSTIPAKSKTSQSKKPSHTSSTDSVSGLFQDINTNKNIQNKESKNIIADSNKEQSANLNDFNKLNEILNKTKNIIDNIDESSNVVVRDSSMSSFCAKNEDYCRQIQDILYNNWKSNWHFDERLFSVVAIKIDKNGIFSFHIKKYSKNHNFDTDLVESLNALKNIIFPVIENKTINLDITFMNKRGD